MSKKNLKDAYESGQWLNPEDFMRQHELSKPNIKTTGKQQSTLFMLPLNIDPDGNEQINALTKETIKGLSLFFVENVRTARRYISSLKLGLTIENLVFHVLDKKTDDKTLFQYLNLLSKAGKAGVMSESGLPGVADPGAKLVALAQLKNIKIKPFAGPSSIFMALMASGLNGQKFSFVGYLPVKPVERKKEIKKLELRSKNDFETIIFIETPYRNDAMYKDLLSSLSAQTKLCIAKGISGKEEFIHTKRVKDWRKNGIKLGKVPTVFLLLAEKA